MSCEKSFGLGLAKGRYVHKYIVVILVVNWDLIRGLSVNID